MRRRLMLPIVMAAVTVSLTAAVAQTAQETFTATASVKKGLASASAPVRVTVTRYATDPEAAAVSKVLKEGGTPALKKMLAGQPDVGTLQLGERQTAIKFALVRTTSEGRLVTVLTAEPMLYLGAGIPTAQPVAGYDVAVAMFELKQGPGSMGELSPAAKVSMSEDGAITISDYGATVIWLTDVAKAR